MTSPAAPPEPPEDATEPGTPWAPGTATGVGSMPGTEPVEVVRLVLGELPGLPFLPELPGRGAPSDVAGRSSAFLAELSVDLQPSGWRLVDRPSLDSHRARDALARDLDALEEAAQASPPALLKVGVAGPWTLASLLELTRGERSLSDAGAVRELTASLAEGVSRHLGDLGRRLPGTRLLLQLDEPALPAVLAARIPTSSGFATLRAPQPQLVAEHLRTVLAVSALNVVHCCAPHPPVELLRRSGALGISLDATLLTPVDDDMLGEAVEAGLGLLLGCVPSSDAELPAVDRTLAPVRALWRRLGLEPERLPATVVITPTCGLAGSTPAYARLALQHCVKAAAALLDEPL